jgi:hypothetical protein
MSRTTSNIHRVITLAVVTVATAITLSTTANARSDRGIVKGDHDAVEIQRESA